MILKLFRFNKVFTVSSLISRDFSKSEKFPNSTKLPGFRDPKPIWKTLQDDRNPKEIVPRDLDVIIIGGGILGWSIAYFLRQNGTLSVGVIERDPSMTRCSTVLGIGAIRQQFSEPENIQMSLFGAEFLRNAREHLAILDLDPPEIQFHPHGFLTLSSEQGFDQLEKCFEVQKSLGAKVELLKKEDIKVIWPWMNVEDVGGGIHGYENEGWFDSWQLLTGLKKKALSLGAHFIHGEAVGVENMVFQDCGKDILRPANILVRQPDGDIMPFQGSKIVVAAGPWSASVGQHLGMGNAQSVMGMLPIPVEPRLQHVFVVSARNSSIDQEHETGPGIDCPFIVDYDGLNVRRDRLGGDFIVFTDVPTLSRQQYNTNNVKSNKKIDDELVGETGFTVDYSEFDKKILPQLARRIPAFANSPIVRGGWAAPLDYNYIDQNAIVGPHPAWSILLMATGCSGHGIEHSLAIGRAIYEQIVFSDYQTIDLSNLAFHRFYEKELIFEKEIF